MNEMVTLRRDPREPCHVAAVQVAVMVAVVSVGTATFWLFHVYNTQLTSG